MEIEAIETYIEKLLSALIDIKESINCLTTAVDLKSNNLCEHVWVESDCKTKSTCEKCGVIVPF